jgi:hypothetical protein
MKHSGYVTWSNAKTQIESWLARVDIPDFGIMGGEPLINPEIRQWLIGVRELMPNTQIRFTTNGILLDKHWDIVELCHDIGNVVFKITAHTDVDEHINKMFAKYEWEEVQEFGISRYKTTNNLRFQINRPQRFLKTYRNSYEDMMPYKSNPLDSFNVCVQQTCPLLYDGKLYKCSTAGLLQGTLERYSTPNREQWKQYVHDGLLPNCTDDELINFIDNFGKPNTICSMCPSYTDLESMIEHQINVIKK